MQYELLLTHVKVIDVSTVTKIMKLVRGPFLSFHLWKWREKEPHKTDPFFLNLIS